MGRIVRLAAISRARRVESRLVQVLILAAALAYFALPAAASSEQHAGRARAGSILLRLRFHRTRVPGYPSGGLAYVEAEGRFAFVGTFEERTIGTLINERTRQQTRLERAGCNGSGALGGPWLAFACGYAPQASNADAAAPVTELYTLATGVWRPVPSSPAPWQETPTLIAVGADWIQFTEGCYHCADWLVFQNIATGHVVSDPTTSHTIPNLDSPALVQAVCSPLRVPLSWEPGPEGYVRTFGSLSFDGRFAFASSASRPTDGSPDTVTSTYLERCGSRLHELLRHDIELAANARLAVWCDYASPGVKGLLLPAARRVEAPLPVTVVGKHLSCDRLRLALSDHTLYALDDGLLLTARAP